MAIIHIYINTGLSKKIIGMDNNIVSNPVINDFHLNLLLFILFLVLIINITTNKVIIIYSILN